MARPLQEIKTLSDHYGAPVLCAGDIFDYWRAEPALINFALNHLPRMYAIPGQHDLPLHRYDLLRESAYWTMVLAGVVENVPPGEPMPLTNGLTLHAFPFSYKPCPRDEGGKGMHVALIHRYIWRPGFCYSGAEKVNEVKTYSSMLEGYDIAVFGDNHKGFAAEQGTTKIFNCGSLMRTKSDQAEYMPQVGLLCESGIVLTHRVRTYGEVLEKTADEAPRIDRVTDLKEFMSELNKLQSTCLDFVTAVEWALNKQQVPTPVRELLAKAIEMQERDGRL